MEIKEGAVDPPGSAGEDRKFFSINLKINLVNNEPERNDMKMHNTSTETTYPMNIPFFLLMLVLIGTLSSAATTTTTATTTRILLRQQRYDDPRNTFSLEKGGGDGGGSSNCNSMFSGHGRELEVVQDKEVNRPNIRNLTGNRGNK